MALNTLIEKLLSPAAGAKDSLELDFFFTNKKNALFISSIQ